MGTNRKEINKFDFEEYTEFDSETGARILIIPKTAIAKMLKVGKTTLLAWMKENGYEDLIKEKPQQLINKR